VLSDVQIIVWDAVNAAKLGGQDGSYYLSRANHVGTQPPSTISPQGSGSGLDADMVDGFHASLTPAPNVIVPLDMNGVLDLSATYVKSNVYTFRRVDLTNATSNYELKLGEEAIINFTNATGVPLRIAVALNAFYKLYCNAGAGVLYPNGISYTDAFKLIDWGVNYDGTTVSRVLGGFTNNGFMLGNHTGTGFIVSYIDTKNCNTLTLHTHIHSTAPYSIRVVVSYWVNPTAWTSLGYINFNYTLSGYILVRRLA
jgi:hypothetical protein